MERKTGCHPEQRDHKKVSVATTQHPAVEATGTTGMCISRVETSFYITCFGSNKLQHKRPSGYDARPSREKVPKKKRKKEKLD